MAQLWSPIGPAAPSSIVSASANPGILTVPAATIWLPTSIAVILTTGVAVGVRTPRLRVLDGAGVVVFSLSRLNVQQLASQVGTITYAPGLPADAAVVLDATHPAIEPFPPNMPLSPGWQIVFDDVSAISAADAMVIDLAMLVFTQPYSG